MVTVLLRKWYVKVKEDWCQVLTFWWKWIFFSLSPPPRILLLLLLASSYLTMVSSSRRRGAGLICNSHSSLLPLLSPYPITAEPSGVETGAAKILAQKLIFTSFEALYCNSFKNVSLRFQVAVCVGMNANVIERSYCNSF